MSPFHQQIKAIFNVIKPASIISGILGALAFLLFTLPSVQANQTPRAYGNWGALSGSNLQVTVPFNPLSVVICNDDTSIVIYADITDGVATTSANSTNIRINAEECHSIPLHDQSAYNTFIVGIIAASGTPQYRLEATR